ncbi:hypothetical protein QQS21_001489 [Conoideocrella luteorostrata]|uniref:Enterotoxin n=1 Tax=Conoideocrella luteorostrata TaxID=1105319 RepID=A0AAJ0CX85_9HYPO|nr:hypothetical protein QQS21_001489 [Conoideocrella luteorostrata]
MRGNPSGGAPLNSAFVSTARDPKAAAEIAARLFRKKSGYVYEIHATQNMFSVSDTLGKHHNIYPNQKEWVAIGGVRVDQIKSVAHVKKSSEAIHGKDYIPELKFKKFDGYDAAKYNGHTAGLPQHELAGFPSNHPALDEPRWRDLAGDPLRNRGLQYLDKCRATGWEPPYPQTPRASDAAQGRPEAIAKDSAKKIGDRALTKRVVQNRLLESKAVSLDTAKRVTARRATAKHLSSNAKTNKLGDRELVERITEKNQPGVPTRKTGVKSTVRLGWAKGRGKRRSSRGLLRGLRRGLGRVLRIFDVLNTLLPI